MTLLQALILGILQGITEFLPISSSGHLEAAKFFFGLSDLDRYIAFDLVCHLGTLCAIAVIFLKQLPLLLNPRNPLLKQLAVATLPLFPFVALLKPIESLYDRPDLLGFFFLLTACILYLGVRFGYEKPLAEKEKSRKKDALIIGVFQAFSLLPGVSRSGSTIATAQLLGWSKQDAINFSFLLAIPAILGGVTLKSLQIIFLENPHPHSLGILHYLIGFFLSFVVGSLSLLWLMKAATKDKFLYFAWYCLLVGLTMIAITR